MKNLFLGLAVIVSGALGVSNARVSVGPLPKSALVAKTVAIVNKTHNDAVSEGAEEALKRWDVSRSRRQRLGRHCLDFR